MSGNFFSSLFKIIFFTLLFNKKRRRIVGGASLFGQGHPGGLLGAIQSQAQEEGEKEGVCVCEFGASEPEASEFEASELGARSFGGRSFEI